MTANKKTPTVGMGVPTNGLTTDRSVHSDCRETGAINDYSSLDGFVFNAISDIYEGWFVRRNPVTLHNDLVWLARYVRRLVEDQKDE